MLNALPQGIIGHDLNRKIFLFSSEAERITGYVQNEVLGRDCHQIFDNNLCGENCAFFDDKGRMPETHCSYDTTYKTKNGSFKEITMTVIPLRNERQETTGVLASLVDRTVLKHSHRRTEEPFRFGDIIGQDHKMQLIYDLIEDLSDSDVPVIISGESGTGKEIIAHAIHAASGRRDKVFVPVNCGALPEGTLESELFGHVKGAFTGAMRDKKGRFELAHTGTLFLDEVGELTLPMQVKLLRVLQHGTFEPVGGEKTVTVDVRVISATNRNLKDMVAKGTFREDLYYRLAVIPIDAPPLRHKKNDIPLLANEFLARVNRETRRNFSFSAEAMKTLVEYAWPGNVRQLQNAIQYATIKSRKEQVLLPNHFPHEVANAAAQLGQPGADGAFAHASRPGRKPKLNAAAVELALAKSGGNKAKAARMLGVGRATLYNFMNEHNGTLEDSHV
ncbi:MAG: hypothetical protein A2268_06055 [Candidatus Raymondbacteria bacterium RifOxyA12_full_50_37]|uniref:Sigma-54-dependent Fis family transcriptional regulator n=1 Tax=Candidatus Raymondbacteria bacterium RIFOXYD12_FULL_49_13 TaxID=1817890 RepID=A0A1F7FKQ2_UNCRA|nr:MAG: hypothetical protein A2268_06055 [Candidatus Raymondbacteria bacterium RifOxyA12_full_50_37]OGJ94581.1 MAG: hypothetical protein A2248_14985 [Candidatus Raymondbacteria bacterium RIFOXYA2_FULL_49_16]OGK07056.1 MAG: hypothetical protein A2519_13625 [Candidatus Raymondbacteria bacterium RIFOXYD12_FULL_49_13]OGP45531.1 MAG: hypothetical protein A2324_15065 [Candidatus Raymondbacteria bacterium RIFOXYB2_FULL_49_35]